MSDPKTPSSPDQPSRLRDLESRLKAARGELEGGAADAESEAAKRSSAMGYAFRVGIELTVGLVVGGVLGWMLDSWLGTKPAFLIVFFFLGAAAGIRNVFRTAQEFNRRPPADQPGAAREDRPGPRDADRKQQGT
jgi:ATP synthase protein I